MEPFFSVDQATQKKEKNKAREQRQSAWWKNQIGKGTCYYCHTKVPPSDLTMDHKTPIARGGKSNRFNLVPCCKDCNNEKKHLTFSEWAALREKEGRPLPMSKDELY